MEVIREINPKKQMYGNFGNCLITGHLQLILCFSLNKTKVYPTILKDLHQNNY